MIERVTNRMRLHWKRQPPIEPGELQTRLRPAASGVHTKRAGATPIARPATERNDLDGNDRT